MSIRLELSEVEAAVIETLIHQAANALEDEIQWADEHQDWEAYQTAMDEYNFFCEITNTIQVQMVEYDDDEYDDIDWTDPATVLEELFA